MQGGFISRWRGQKSTIFVSRKKSRRCALGGGGYYSFQINLIFPLLGNIPNEVGNNPDEVGNIPITTGDIH